MVWNKILTNFIGVINKDYKTLSIKNSEAVLHDLLGDDVYLIEQISFDPIEGRFHSVVAPENIIAKLREAGYLGWTEEKDNIVH